MKKFWHFLTGKDSNVFKKKHSSETTTRVEEMNNKEHHSVPPIVYPHIESIENQRIGKDLISAPLGYSPIYIHSRPNSTQYSRSHSPPVHVQRRMNTGLNSPWNQLFAIDSSMGTMKSRLEQIDQDLSTAFDMLGLNRGEEERAEIEPRQELVRIEWISEEVYNFKFPVGVNIKPDDITVNLEKATLVISFYMAEELATGQTVKKVTKTVAIPPNVDFSNMRVLWKPPGYLHIEAPLLPEGRKESNAGKIGKLPVQTEDKSRLTGKQSLQRETPTKIARVALKQDVNRFTVTGVSEKDANLSPATPAREDPRNIQYNKAGLNVTTGRFVKVEGKEALSPSAV